jgi:small subunit ribosomal protein S29
MKKKGKSLTVQKHRVSASLRKKKKKVTERARPPAVGERKALRKRIVLSNPNALEIEGMLDLSPETMVDSRLRGSVLGLPAPMIDQLRAVQAFKPKQGWSIFRRPGTVLRRDTIEMGRLFEQISGEGESPQKGKVVKKIVTGMKGSGKTVHLLQAMAMGFLKNWAVITVPDGMFIGQLRRQTLKSTVADLLIVQLATLCPVTPLIPRSREPTPCNTTSRTRSPPC